MGVKAGDNIRERQKNMIKYRTCGICPGGCRVKITIEEDKIVKVEADRNSPAGRVCMRGALAPEILYGSDRLTHPMIRDGEKGEGKFRTVSWEEALDHTEGLLKRIMEENGGTAMAGYQGRGILGMPMSEMLSEDEGIIYKLGSLNRFSCDSICNTTSSILVPLTTMGMDISYIMQDMENSEYIFVWGRNPRTDSGPQTLYKRIKSAVKKGAKLVVIDPEKKGMGREADLWVPVIPGTDGALALAMLKKIIEEERYDKEFVEHYTRGFEEFREYLSKLSTEKLLKSCGISRELLEQLTDIFCSTEKISLVSFTGLEYQPSAVQNGRAVMTLFAVTGKLDVEGGMYFTHNSLPVFRQKEGEERKKLIGEEEFPVFCKVMERGQFSCFPKAVKEQYPYPVRGLIISGASPILTYPERQLWEETYKHLDALIIFDRYMTEDMRFADVIFPVSTAFETWSTDRDESGNPVVEEPSVSPAGECRDEVRVLMEIGRRLGIKDYPQTDEEFRDWLRNLEERKRQQEGQVQRERAYRKYRTGLLRKDGQPGFPTPSGRFEIASSLLEENGIAAIPVYEDIFPSDETWRDEYPLVMTTGMRSMHRMGVFGSNIPQIAVVEKSPFMDISEKDAQELEIKEGEEVRVVTPFGEGRYRAHLCDMAEHSIQIPHGGGSIYMQGDWKEKNVNDLTCLEYRDPISGFPVIKAIPCRIEK